MQATRRLASARAAARAERATTPRARGPLSAAVGAEIIELPPDNPSFKLRKLTAGSEDLRVVAELVEVLA